MIVVPFLLVKPPPSGVIVRAAGIEKSAPCQQLAGY